MKKIVSLVLSIGMLLPLIFSFVSCNKKEGTITFDTRIQSTIEGLGVEWGVYEDTNKLGDGAWEKILESVDRLNPSLVRCMLNFDWIVTDHDDKGTTDLNDDTWSYDFQNKYMKNCCQVLDYCQDHGIKVAIGVWNVIGSVDESVDTWGMIPNATSDIRWAKMVADLCDYLVNNCGYDCIKWFVNSNEPNYKGVVGSSKNAYNSYEKWETGVLNIRSALDAIGLTSIDIIGGDTTGLTGSYEYLPNIANNLSDVVNNYGIHMYVSNYDIDMTKFGSDLSALYTTVQKLDSSLGNTKSLIIWEAGLLDGKNTTTDSNAYIGNFSYGMRMADYTVQSLLAGVSGIAYWDLDDAMHFMYLETGTTAKEWGMFSSLGTATAQRQEYRPWYYSSVLLTNLIRPGSTIYASSELQKNPEENFRTLAVVSQDGKDGGIVAINRSSTALTKTFQLETNVSSSDTVYVYYFNEKNLSLDETGAVCPNQVLSGSINDTITLEIPASCLVVLSTKKL